MACPAARARASARSSMRRAPAANWRKPTSCGSLARKAAISTRSSQRPTGCAPTASAIRSPTSINRNINYTNICLYHCGFCAFSKGRGSTDLRGPAYRLDLEEIARRTREAAAAGATEVCLQGGIHPSFTGETYLDIVAAVKSAVPSIHVHAFSPLEDQARRRDARAVSRPPTSSGCARRDSRRCPERPPKFSTMRSETSSVPIN